MTINKGRDAHLARLLEGLARSVSPPAEIVVVEIGGKGPLRHDGSVVRVPLDAEGLPLARARNAGRRAATGDVLVFLDVDCIPSRDLVSALTEAAASRDALVCCEVFYLSDAVGNGWTEDDLRARSVPHPARRFPRFGLSSAPQPGLFWSLAFGVSAAVYDRIGGFDEAFCGYGAEDTDLAFRAASLDIPILFAAAGKAFHQRHATCDPPLPHFADIVRNATLFRARHGVWAMRGWLEAFERLGLIAIGDDRLKILRYPSPADIEAASVPATRAF